MSEIVSGFGGGGGAGAGTGAASGVLALMMGGTADLEEVRVVAVGDFLRVGEIRSVAG